MWDGDSKGKVFGNTKLNPWKDVIKTQILIITLAIKPNFLILELNMHLS